MTRLSALTLTSTCTLALWAMPDTTYVTVWVVDLGLIVVGSYGICVAVFGRWWPQ